ncbi:hypothetical protein GCM10011571_21260 [Marinithermofilum abyssi]|uniref:Uncharacterized protein n=1 Tax=Marinithermofilum abyssi TaxID=1571185 RepID=A0A8J2VC20_9BACL|nr:hypothetical protein GCM10011571_21260 [Marinithermofilum abyssi]
MAILLRNIPLDLFIRYEGYGQVFRQGKPKFRRETTVYGKGGIVTRYESDAWISPFPWALAEIHTHGKQVSFAF